MSAFSDARVAYVCAVENIRFETVTDPSRYYSCGTRYSSDLVVYMSSLRGPAGVFTLHKNVNLHYSQYRTFHTRPQSP